MTGLTLVEMVLRPLRNALAIGPSQSLTIALGQYGTFKALLGFKASALVTTGQALETALNLESPDRFISRVSYNLASGARQVEIAEWLRDWEEKLSG